MSDTAPIEDAVQTWVQAWSGRDKGALMSLWDSDDPDSTYLPAEQENPLIGAGSVEKYIESLCSLFGEVRHRPGNIIIKRLSDDIGLAFYVLDWAVADRRGPIGGQCRVTAVWKKQGERWVLTHYAEAPLAPLVELKEFYQHVAAEGLPA